MVTSGIQEPTNFTRGVIVIHCKTSSASTGRREANRTPSALELVERLILPECEPVDSLHARLGGSGATGFSKRTIVQIATILGRARNRGAVVGDALDDAIRTCDGLLHVG